MFYGNTIIKEVESIDDLYNSLQVEYENFNKIIDSLNILQENNILLEADNKSIFDRLKGLWERFKKFISGLVNSFKNKFSRKKDEEKLKAVQNNISKNTDNTGDIELLKPTNDFMNAIKEYENKQNDLIEKIKSFCNSVKEEKNIDTIKNMSFDSKDIDNLFNIFDRFGGASEISSKNEKCFEHIKTNSTNANNICSQSYKDKWGIAYDIWNNSSSFENVDIALDTNLGEWYHSSRSDNSNKDELFRTVASKLGETINQTAKICKFSYKIFLIFEKVMDLNFAAAGEDKEDGEKYPAEKELSIKKYGEEK